MIALRSGVTPDIKDCIHVINKGHSRAAMACVEALPENNRNILFAAIRRRYDPLFHAVLGRFDKYVTGLIDPPFRDQPVPQSGARKRHHGPQRARQEWPNALEEVCVHKRIAHIDVLMRQKTKGTTRAFRLMLRDPSSTHTWLSASRQVLRSPWISSRCACTSSRPCVYSV